MIDIDVNNEFSKETVLTIRQRIHTRIYYLQIGSFQQFVKSKRI